MGMMKENRRRLMILLFTVAGGSCSFFSAGIPVQVRLPPDFVLPAGWCGSSMVWDVRWGDSEGFHCRTIDMGVTRISVNVPAGGVGHIAMTATPRNTENGRSLYPAGVVLRMDNPEPQSFSWSDGAVADLLLSLFERGIHTDLVNTDRLLAEATWRAPGDPWLLDREVLLAAFTGQTMRSSLIRTLDTVSVVVPVPAGHYLPESVCAGTVAAVQAGDRTQISVAVVPLRRALWWSLDGCVEVRVWCDDAGHCNRHVRETGYCSE